jgi:hypothetical protein
MGTRGFGVMGRERVVLFFIFFCELESGLGGGRDGDK